MPGFDQGPLGILSITLMMVQVQLGK
jgi:hypothetical protein